ncbi:heat-inducible transcription repressor HrcA [Lachnospiraceae oral taxon 107 str. F0167]|uniref:heat-inducible transcriptional repressor HrcA n=1 Tax=Lachnoanaerobaculum sp. Marseille-Q4761 TaxID=2819511 RepID=UPI00020838DB|nr:heat-inducible transcriptional repressor HrcA [Lachnoanaerobaculum sp. Marseille-Q4761]EGG90451.1 heat-inducible transcription repressor HrcA [Lachnospiraceae oral taxon 107 str. F0167]MBO1870245.1 heat-inducible transcription repressor HrcA [Lachnoanaerobaculum sp. Marseille-Q4761]RKW49001.1 MAG: heat-inducible transcription repressor HrcA [Lachnospiraceae bacterium]
MDSEDRKAIILKAIIKNYMETGEPVGSRTISKLPELNLSSATIRNEMSDLEEMGYILQPHTSAGRIPSDKGYRFYVDEMLREKEIETEEFKDLMFKKVDRLETVLKQLAKVIARDTNYAAMISGPTIHSNKVKFLQLSKIDKVKLLLVTVAEGNIINNKIIDIESEISEAELLNLNLLINTSLNGLTVEEINLSIMNKLRTDAGVYGDIVDKVLREVAAVFESATDNLEIYTSGTTNIFKYPEISDREKASQLVNAFEEKDKLKAILAEVNEDDKDGIRVYIGNEVPVSDMRDLSVVTANYEIGEGLRGTIGIVGPKRMDYEKVLKTIKTVMASLDEQFKNDE